MPSGAGLSPEPSMGATSPQPPRESRTKRASRKAASKEAESPQAAAPAADSWSAAELERARWETANLTLRLDETARELAERDRDIALLRGEVEKLRHQHGGATAESENLRSQLATLSETVADLQSAAASSDQSVRFLASACRALTAPHQPELDTVGTLLVKQLIHLWHYTIGDDDGAAGVPGSSTPIRRNRIRLGFYSRLAEDEIAALRVDVEKSGLFDADWYRQRHPECRGAMPAVEFFVRVGLSEDHDPHPLFDTAWYRRQAGESDLRGAFPFIHFIRGGAAKGMSPHPLFDTAWYLAKNPEIAETRQNPLNHFLFQGAAEGRPPHPAFDTAWYLRSRGAAWGGRNPLVEYVIEPDAWSASPHPLFDPEWYTGKRGGAVAANPLLDYLQDSGRDRRNPHPLFDTRWYVHANPDAAESGQHPFIHFLRSEPKDCRQTSPWFDAKWYRATYPRASADQHPLLHYVTDGRAAGHETTSSLLLGTIRDVARQVGGSALPPILAYLAGPDDPRAGEGRVAASGLRAAAELPRQFAFDPGEPAPDHPVYWLPDPLREYIMNRFGMDAVPPVRHLMGILSRYEKNKTQFARSYDCRWLIAELRRLAVDPDPDAPVDVSVVIPVFNALPYTLTCLHSLLSLPTRYRIEVLIADDASHDATGVVIPAIGGRVRHVRHAENLGFLLNCNVSALQARGRYLVLLNNDTIVLPRWLDMLIGAFDLDPTIGFVGSKLLNADGTLQEAGGIFWKDGSAWNFGRNQSPAMPEFNYLKDADYCSGAAIAVPRATWRSLGGFDPAFTPAYCEESDLAYRVRAAGQRVIYQPFAEIIHHEGKSHGVDTSAGIKAYQVVNLKKFSNRWHSYLLHQHFPNAQDVFLARDRSRTRPHILIVDHYIPKWDQDCGSRLMYLYILMFLENKFHVTFWPDNLYEDPNYAWQLQMLGVEVIYSNRYRGKFDEWMRANGKYFQYALLSRPHIAINYIDSIKQHSDATIMYYGHDIHWRRTLLEYELTRKEELLASVEYWREMEGKVIAGSDVIFYPSAEECSVIEAGFPDKLVLELPVSYFGDDLVERFANVRRAEAARDLFHLLFVGGFGHTPNNDAVLWLAGEILPLLWRIDERYHVTIVGSEPPEEVCALASDRIEVTGYISDERLTEFYRSVGVVIAPLRFGAGVKGKVIEAFANCVPVVTTAVGVQGIDDPDETAFVADEPADFARLVHEASTDREAALRKVEAALKFLQRKYSRTYVREVLTKAVVELRSSRLPVQRRGSLERI